MMMDDCDRLRFKPRSPNPEGKEPYEGVNDPSRKELAAAGYETLVKADPKRPWAFEDRDTLSEDAEYDIDTVRRV